MNTHWRILFFAIGVFVIVITALLRASVHEMNLGHKVALVWLFFTGMFALAVATFRP